MKKAEYNEKTLRLKIGKQEKECFTIAKALTAATKKKCDELWVVGKREKKIIDLRLKKKLSF